MSLRSTDSEHTGVGEIATCWTPDGVDQCRCVTEKLAPLVEGTSDPTNSINLLVAAMDAAAGMDFGPAKAGVEMALLDLAGKELGVSVSTLLGGRVRDRIPLSHSIGYTDSALMADLAKQKVEEVVVGGITIVDDFQAADGTAALAQAEADGAKEADEADEEAREEEAEEAEVAEAANEAMEATEGDEEPTIDWPPKENDFVLVPCSMWPTYTCSENGGRGWLARLADGRAK